MDEKKYEYHGTVTISTEEYRDILTAMYDAKHEFDRKNREWCEQYNKANELEKKLKTSEEENKKMFDFITSKKEYKLAYKMFIAGVEEEEEE